MRGIAECHSDDAGHETDEDELEREQPEDVNLREPQAAHHRARVQVPQREAPRRRRHRDRRDHCGQQRDECEESLGTVDRALHLRPAAFQRLDTLAALQFLLQCGGKFADRRAFASDQQAIGDAAAGRDQLRGREIVEIHHHARREVDELGAAIRLDHDDLADAERLLAQLQSVAGSSTQRLQQLAVDPDLAPCRDFTRRALELASRVRDPQGPAQRIAIRHGFHRCQCVAILVAYRNRHARKDDGPGQLQPGRSLALADRFVDWRIRAQHEVGAQQLGCIALESEADPIDEEAHAGHGGHCNDQRRRQQSQFAGTPVARGHAR